MRHFFRKEAVLWAAAFAAGISMFFVPPAFYYLKYIDFRVLVLLFSLMAVVSGFQKIGVFAAVGQKLMEGAQNIRLLCMILVMLCFFSSMLITNDVALITFVPFSILVLTLTGQSKHILYVIVLQTVAANLGSMLTPVGNPQNLYLYSYYQYSPLAFFKLTLPVTGISLVLLILLTGFVKTEHIVVRFTQKMVVTSRPKLVLYALLFILCLLCVFYVLPYPVLLIAVVAVLGIVDKSVFRHVDYGLLATFVCFFIVCNMGLKPSPLGETFRSTIY